MLRGTAQLAQIAAKSTNSLDLKAQKKAHSQSLLFEPRVAATQDFDTIYQICYEGFEELCQLDSRFISFARNVFSEQSKQEDRTQMTAAQNTELDDVLEDFLGLVGARLLLRPALKAVEWLVRRFKVHEYNTLPLLLTFLPYHTTSMFPTLLSILPPNIPPALKFLRPYTQSLTNPSRHTIVYSAAHNHAFFSALNTYVLKVTRTGYHYRALTSFWAAIATEAIARMLDQSRSGRREVQGQNEEDVLLRVLPMISEGLSMKKAPEFRVGCYMILTVLATKASLNEKVLTAMMEAVTSNWTEDTTHAGLICLAVLAQQRQTILLPKRVLTALLAVERIDDDLVTLHKQYTVEKLALGLVLGTVDALRNTENRAQLTMIRTLLEAQLMREPLISTAVKHIVLAAQNIDSIMNTEFDLQGQLADLILRLVDSTSIGEAVQKTITDSSINVEQLESKLQTIMRTGRALPEVPDSISEDSEMINTDQSKVTESFEAALSQIPTRTAYEVSFLSHSKSYVFGSLCHAFLLASTSPSNVNIFSDSLVLRKHLAMTEPLYFSFFVRIWCGDYPAIARVAALCTVLEYFKNEKSSSDVQALLPYVVHALGDSSKKVRETATELVLALATSYAKSDVESKKRKNRSIWGHDNIYGEDEQTKNVSWITTDETAKFIEDVLVPALEECVLDATYISRHLADALNGSKHVKLTKSLQKEIKTALRVAILSFLSSHIISTPLYTVKLRLLTILNHVEKVGGSSRTKALLPLLVLEKSRSENSLKEACDAEHIELSQFAAEIVGIVSAADRDGIHILQSIIEEKDQPISSALASAAAQRTRTIWPSMKPDLQMSFSKTLLSLSVDTSGTTPEEENRQSDAVEILRNAPLSTNILLSFLEDLPTLSDNIHEKPSAAKRRRTSDGHVERGDGSADQLFALSIRKVTLVLELIDASKPERHPQLLKGLFHTVGDLQHYRAQSGTELGYLQTLALGSLRAIVEEIKISAESPFYRSYVRIDILVDCIRMTASPQVQHAALLLVSSLASVTPEVVLHSVMPVFTFMGASLLRQGDDYSAHVVTQTIDSVIPPLVDSLRKQKEGPVAGASELLLSFVAAFEHIPSHRRFGLFHSLINKLGPLDFLFALLVMLANKYPGNKSVAQFAADLTCRYGPETQLITVGKYVDIIYDTLEAKPSISEKLLALGNEESQFTEDATLNLLPLLAQILNSERLIQKSAKILGQGGPDAGRLREIYSQLIEQVLVLSEKVRAQKKLHSACGQVLNALLNLLSMREFVGSLESLLDRSNDEVRRHVLKSLEQRVNLDKGGDKASQEACLSLLPRLTSMLETSTNTVLKHTTIACIDRIAERYGKKDVDAVASAARVISGDSCLGATDSRLRVMALLCLASSIEVIGEGIIPVIPQALPKSIEHLQVSIKEDEEDARLHNAVYSFMGSLLLYVPWIVTGAHLDRLLRTSSESANAEMGEDCDKSRIAALRLVAKQTYAKECFAALERTWTCAMTEGPHAVAEHLEILSLAIEKHPKSVIAKNSSLLSGLFLKYFDLRRIQCSPRTEDSYEEDEIEAVEDAVNDVAIKMIYKLNDATFRPVFVKLLDWATAPSAKESKAKLHRQMSWYSFLHSFFETMKSIITSYAGFIIDSAVEVLSGDAPKDEPAKLLWKRVLQTLHSAFEHDQDEFWQSPSHFAAISNPLLAQLAHASTLPANPSVIPTITAFAVAADSPDHHKAMNATILKHMRSDNPAVRLDAVQCEQSLTARLGEEWLALLPEMLPCISELLEDDDERVERETRRWVLGIEGVLGESLEGMLP
ncbi:MAG: hypothetical protein FRX48_09641 [Lasallia pustulata]|uniref:U3 small nucleolar RNA-associated protein 10 n=1 Tax=Lasallia pustulata TaxID=136370 RepID=A0A5M8PC64_9LECA|nr:MAG: hypothetical protein FRX48_09641 [Lasallia pustulata]